MTKKIMMFRHARRITRWAVLLAMLSSIALADAPPQPFLNAVETGAVHLTIEGLEGGEKVALTFANTGKKPVRVEVPPGDTRILVADNPQTVVIVSATEARKVDVAPGKEASVTVAQKGRSRLESGKIVFIRLPNGITRNFQNARFAVRAE